MKVLTNKIPINKNENKGEIDIPEIYFISTSIQSILGPANFSERGPKFLGLISLGLENHYKFI